MLWSRNFQKYSLKKFQTGGRVPGAPVLDPPLVTNATGEEAHAMGSFYSRVLFQSLETGSSISNTGTSKCSGSILFYRLSSDSVIQPGRQVCDGRLPQHLS